MAKIRWRRRNVLPVPPQSQASVAAAAVLFPSTATARCGIEAAMAEVGFGIGSNMGDKLANVRRAQARLFGSGAVRFRAASSIYRTAPWGYAAQDWFANACAVGDTDLPPADLLALTQELERSLGRTPSFRWGPRLIDIDILYYEGAAIESARLTLPHRELFARAFVLVPLAEIRPALVLGGRGIAAAAAASASDDVSILAPPWSPVEAAPVPGSGGTQRG
jgi:2-amino-4-hydroxy-6-hydroxymethyldihydropteridine diphosphokinase